MKYITNFFKIIFCFVLLEPLFINQSSAFFPKINEPNQKELESAATRIANTAVQLIQFDQNEEAIRLLKLAVRLNPQETQLWTSLAEAQSRTNQNKEALESLTKASNLEPDKAEIFFRKGSIHMSLNNPYKAKSFITKGLSINKNNERGYFQLGNAEIMLNNYNSALNAFKKSSKINSNFWQSINNQGLVLYELNNYKQAISKFRSAMKISNDPEPMLALAIVLYNLDNKSIQSLKLAKIALNSNPKYVFKEYQKKQLWGKKLQKSAQLLFKNKEMRKIVKEAKEKSMN